MSERANNCFCGECAACKRGERYRLKRAAVVGCPCGCTNCDCARWERIYREKFEDPTYYTRERFLGNPQSCLAGLVPDVDLWGASIPEVAGERDAMRRSMIGAAREGIARRQMRLDGASA